MARPRCRARSLLDTSAVVYQLHGHTLQQHAVREVVDSAAAMKRRAQNSCESSIDHARQPPLLPQIGLVIFPNFHQIP